MTEISVKNGVRIPNVQEYYRIIVNNRKSILAVTLTVALATAIVSLLLPNYYTATARVLPQQQPDFFSNAMLQSPLANLAGDILPEKGSSKVFAEFLKVDSLRIPIIERFKLMEVYDTKYRQDALGELNSHVSVQAGKEGIVSISVEDRDPKRAADIANAFVDELQKMNVRLNSTGAASNRMFLEERLKKSKTDLGRSQDALKRFQEENKAFALLEQASGAMKGIAELQGQLTEREVELQVLRRTKTESNQQVKNMKAAIANLRAQISRLESGKSGGIIPQFGSVPELAKEYSDLMRDVKINETLVEVLTKQFEMAALNEASNVSVIQVVQTAVVPEKKSRPARAKMVLTAMFVTLFFSSVFVLIRNSLSGSAEVKNG